MGILANIKSRVKENKKEKDLLHELKEKRDLAVKWRKQCGWNERLKRSVNYYQYGVGIDLSESANEKKHNSRKANYVFSNIEAIIPKIFDRLPSFQVSGRGSEDIEKAPKVEAILRYKLEQINFEEIMEDNVRDMLVKSIGYIRVTWDTRVRKGKDKEIESVVNDDIQIELVQPDNIWITAGDYRIEKADGVFELMLLTPEEVKEKWHIDMESGYHLIDSDENKMGGRVGVWRYSGLINGKKAFWWFTDEKLLAEDKFYEHGKLPYIDLANYRMSHEFYPWSEVYQIEPLQDELIEIDNQASEFRKRCVNPKKFIQEGVVDQVNEARLKDPRINVVKLKDLNGVKWEQPSLIGQDIYNFRNIKKEDIGLMTGQNEISRGGTERVVKTATGQQILFDAAQGRIRHKVRAMERTIKEVLIQMQGLLAEFQDKEEQVKITEDQIEAFTKEDIQGNYDFVIDIVDTMPILREKRAQLALQAYQMFSKDPDVDTIALKKMVMKKAFADIGAEKLIKDSVIEKAPDNEQPDNMEQFQQSLGSFQIPPVPLNTGQPTGAPMLI